VLLDGGEVVEQWSSLVNPGQRIPSSIEDFTGISNEMVADAPSFDDLRVEVRRRLAGATVRGAQRTLRLWLSCATNSVASARSSPRRVLCTVRLSRALFREHARHNLDTLIERYGLACEARHGARRMPGAAAAARAFESVAGREQLQRRSRGAHESRAAAALAARSREDLPRGPVYTCSAARAGALLYVGKSRSLRRPGARALRERASLGQGIN